MIDHNAESLTKAIKHMNKLEEIYGKKGTPTRTLYEIQEVLKGLAVVKKQANEDKKIINKVYAPNPKTEGKSTFGVNFIGLKELAKIEGQLSHKESLAFIEIAKLLDSCPKLKELEKHGGWQEM